MSPDYTDFVVFVPPSLIWGIQCTTCSQKGHHFEVCLKRYTYSTHCEHYGHYSTNCLMKKLTPLDWWIWLFKKQVEDGTLSQAASHCSLNESHRDLELREASQPVRQISESSRQNNWCMNPFYSFVFLSVMRKTSNALVYKCPQRCLKDQPTKIGIATPQSIQHSKNS
jgi:hypothetical protein